VNACMPDQSTYPNSFGASQKMSATASIPLESATSSKPSTSKSELTAERLRELLSYGPTRGEFRWRRRDDAPKGWNTKYAGTVAGVLSHGYIVIRINKQPYLAHRLVWLYVHGRWPPNDIDHINGDRADNHIANLREATRQENNRNVGLRKNSTTGITGVHRYKRTRKYQAYIAVGRKSIHLGCFSTLEEAAAARAEAEIEQFKEFRRAA
jgi:hypothetical protein